VNAPRADYLTPLQHFQEAQRLLWVVDEALQDPGQSRTLGDLAIIAQAHAVTGAVAADVFGEDDGDEDQAAEDTRRLDRIRVVLAKFDWEHDDRQLALEAIERIAEGGQA
jgi:hypothetical protein